MGKKSARTRAGDRQLVTADVTHETKSETATQAKTLEEKLALIQALQANIQRRIRHINRPAAMAVTAVTVPAVVSVLFLNERWSPFYKYYDQTYHAAVEHYDEEIVRLMDEKVIAPYVVPMQNEIENFIREKKAALFLICNDKGFAEDTCIDDALGFLDTNLEFKDVTNLFKTKLIEHFNVRLASFKQGGKVIKFTDLLDANVNKHTAKKLFHDVEEAGKKFILAVKDHFYKQGGSESKRISRNVLNRYVVQYKVLAAMLAQYFIVEPLVTSRFPHGVFQDPIPQVEALPVDSEEADSIIELLEEHDATLARVERRNAKYARIGSAVVLSGSFFDLSRMVGWLSLNGLLPTELVIIFCIGLIATGSVDLLKDLYRLYESLVFEGFSLWGGFVFESYFKQQQETLKNIVGTNSYELTSVNKGSLETSRFVLKFHKVKDGMSPDKLARILKNILVSCGVKTKIVEGNGLIIPADFALDGEQIKRLFVTAIEREQNIVTLEKQVRDLLGSCFIDDTAYLPMSGVTRAGLPITTIEFCLPLAANAYTQKFIELFAANEIDITERNRQLSIVITGAACADANELKDLCDQLKAAIQKEANDQKTAEPVATPSASAADNSEVDQDDKSSVRRRVSAQTAASAKSTENRDTKAVIPPPIAEPRRVIKWGKVVYDSDSKTNTAHPLNVGQFHNYRSFVNAHRFIMNGLVRKDAKKSSSKKGQIRSEIYDAIDAHVKVPVLVPPKGRQGFVFWSSPQVDQNGNPFTSSMKLKLYGVFGKGDVRAFTRLVAVSPEGDQLHDVVAVNLKAH